MPRTLFDHTLTPHTANRRPIGTLSLSIILHAGALAVLLLSQFTSSIQGLVVGSPLPAYVAPLPPTPVTPPPVRVSPPTHAVSPLTAPTVSPDNIPTEPPVVAAPAVAGVPDSPTVGVPDTGGIFARGDRQIVIAKPPPPQPRSPLPVGGDIRAPERVFYVPPVYPQMAITARIDGEVVIEAIIDETGAVRDLVVRQSIPLLDRAAKDAVSKWRYSPTRLNGQPVAVIMLVRVKFSLK